MPKRPSFTARRAVKKNIRSQSKVFASTTAAKAVAGRDYSKHTSQAGKRRNQGRKAYAKARTAMDKPESKFRFINEQRAKSINRNLKKGIRAQKLADMEQTQANKDKVAFETMSKETDRQGNKVLKAERLKNDLVDAANESKASKRAFELTKKAIPYTAAAAMLAPILDTAKDMQDKQIKADKEWLAEMEGTND